ncbi:DUF1329 domain-containing protein [Fontimonas sp. SYSU GA230001]|uniref:DUF1329 domain-containing protein n=1 Tax=Fontimonas sp. SYSU GA230001 TaxID=3142450 RepID=UPI0032B5809D
MARRMLGWAVLAVLCGTLPVPVQAAVSAEEATRLGQSLTPAGAEAAGNADGSIPAWEGSQRYRPEQLRLTYAELKALREKNPKALESRIAPVGAAAPPLFTITRANFAQYADRLSAGHRALFERYPEYRMPVYPSIRAAFLSPEVEAATRENALKATLDGTDKLGGARLGVPFPVPKSGAEVIWNHKLKFRGNAVRRFNNEVIVAQDGSYTLARIIEDVKMKYANPRAPSAIEDSLILLYLQEVLSPKRIAGQMLLVHETTDQTEGGRNAWIFNPGLGRTRRAPNVGYDNPKASADGLMFNDQTDMFNGALDRYTWKLLGKREMYIPYNSTRIIAPDVSYEKLIRKGHVNPELTRYELHRVWVVEAALKAGLRHSFRRRVFYVDEDSWSIAMVDCYDDRDQLWRFQEAHLATFPFVPATTGSPEVHHDLQNGRYFVTASYTGDDYPDFSVDFDDGYFRPQTLASRKLRK